MFESWVIELKNDRCLTLIANNVSSGYTSSWNKIDLEAQSGEPNAQVVQSKETNTRKAQSTETNGQVSTRKLKWFSEETLPKY